MSSHREAPEISKDPVADSTDTYAFVSPDRPGTVTLITNYIPLEDPAGGPNFFEFGDDVLYVINVDHTGDGKADVKYEFRFKTKVRNPNTFLYNTGPITSLRRQEPQPGADLHGHRGTQGQATGPRQPTCSRRPATSGRDRRRTTPSSPATPCTIWPGGGVKVFAGQRLDPFFVDLGAIFDLAALRPFQNLHLIPTAAASGINALRAFNVHTIAIQVPIARLTRNRNQGHQPDVEERHHRCLGFGVPAQGHDPPARQDDRVRPVHAGVAAREPACSTR